MTTNHDKYEIDPADQEWLQAEVKQLTFARALKAHRLGEDWSQVELAQKLGISKQLYNAYEVGRKLPSPKAAFELAIIVGMVPQQAVLLVLNDQLRRENLPLQVGLAS